MTEIDKWVNDIHEGDVLETLRALPESSVHLVVTSPPYFNLRDYGVDGQIGLEDSLDAYVETMVDVGHEIRRVLRDDGSWWLNLGDSFAGSNRGSWNEDNGEPKESYSPDVGDLPHHTTNLQRKSKMMVPHRVAIALQSNEWVVRSDAVWKKENPMPHPVKDRLNEHKEFFFHLTAEPNYWFDLDAIREQPQESSIGRDDTGGQKTTNVDPYPGREGKGRIHNFDRACHPNGKNPGDILEVAVRPFPKAHFATFPPELVETPIKASCPPKVCAVCGAPYERSNEEIPVWELENPDRPQLKRALEIADDAGLTEDHFEAIRSYGFADAGHGKNCQTGTGNNTDEVESLAKEAKEALGGYFREFVTAYQDTGNFEQACDCPTVGEYTEPGIVLDPFAGAGTTCLVAKRLNRRFVGIDLNPEYVALAQKRVGITVDEPERLLEDGETSLLAYADGGDPQ
ncbi:DNA-methyltransferase [Natronosalvus amylolyticus]|uniref:DNA-methyltransferase n=1 Tax=Natronosalvus amylolyticus TaxID=2961994 RepID=UPI0020C98947|nr:site-specific DNA-methyltransferase [Natronosalvus amylolyticus]